MTQYSDMHKDEYTNENQVDVKYDDIAGNSEQDEHVCKQCGTGDIEDGYLLNLCANCRDELSRFRVPIWVKGFAVLVIAVLIAALIKFPDALNVGVSFERAIKYEAEKKYMSAMKEYEKAALEYPDSTTVLCRLFIAQYKAGKIQSAVTTYDKLIGRDVEDEALYNEVSEVLTKLDTYYFPREGFMELLNTVKEQSIEQVAAEITGYVNNNPDDVFAELYLVSTLMESGESDKAVSAALNVLNEHPDFVDCSFLLGAIYREMGEYDKAISIYNKLLESNIERADAYSGIARIELKKGNDKSGLDMAVKAYGIDDSDPFVISNLVLAYHFNNMTAERDKVFDIFKKMDNYSENDYELLTNIINGTDNNWRD